ncbi:MAG: NAD(P)H-dependent oxidoreductase subunit E [Acidobacteriota bacterium]
MKNKVDKKERQRGKLIELLHQAQAEKGYVSPEAITSIGQKLRISEGDIFGVLTFYKAFSLTPRGKHLITICMGTACHVRGAPMILDEFERELKIQAGNTSEDGLFTLETVNCVGACALGPIAIVDEEYHGQMKSREVSKLVRKLEGT